MLTTQMITFTTHSTSTRMFTVTSTDITTVILATTMRRNLKMEMKMEMEVVKMSYP